MIPCLLAAMSSDYVSRAWLTYIGSPPEMFPQIMLETTESHLNLLLLVELHFSAFCFGLAAMVFVNLSLSIKAYLKLKFKKHPYLSPGVGGVAIILLVTAIGENAKDYLGLGAIPLHPNSVTVSSAFLPGGAYWYSFLLKLLFTAITLASGFKGGEVSPLFFIGATLGNQLGVLFNQSAVHVPIFAATGLVSTFAAATNTPLASSVLAFELFGIGGNAVMIGYTCFISYLVSGYVGIYVTQRVERSKIEGYDFSGVLLKDTDNIDMLKSAQSGSPINRTELTQPLLASTELGKHL